MITQGGYGCIYHPSLKCKNMPSSPMFATKVQIEGFNSWNETKIGAKVASIDPSFIYFLPECFLLKKFGNLKIIQDGKLHQDYNETKISSYMKNENIELDIEIFTGIKSFTTYTMDFTKKYIEINADYRS